MSAHAYADMPLATDTVKLSILSKSRADALIVFPATLTWLNPSLKIPNYVAVHYLL